MVLKIYKVSFQISDKLAFIVLGQKKKTVSETVRTEVS